jgi:broad specificity phosphatase PhoE
VTHLVIVRHAEPLMVRETPGAEWPLTEKGRNDAGVLGTRLASRFTSTVVWTSPERRARETAALAFPLVATRVWDQLREVKKPWYSSADEHANAVGKHLRGEIVEGLEHREAVNTRIVQLKLGFGTSESLVLVSHGLFLTMWLDYEVGLDDPFSFWSSLRMPDVWNLDLKEKSFERIV